VLGYTDSVPAGCSKLDTPGSASGGQKQHLERSQRDASNRPLNGTPLLDRQTADLQTDLLKL